MPLESPTRFVMVPARRSSEPAGRKRARRILAALFLAATLSVVAVFVALAKGQRGVDLSTVDPKGRETAVAAAVDYLAGDYQNVPHATSLNPDDLARAAPDLLGGRPSSPLPYRSLAWVGFTPEHFGSGKAGFTDFEIHHFLVVLAPSASSSQAAPDGTTPPTTGDPAPDASTPPTPAPAPAPSDGATPAPASNLLQLDVPILITPQGPRLAAAPAPAAWSGGTGAAAGAGDYTNYANLVTDVSDAVKTQVVAWAKAYVNGDSNALLMLTGDQNPHHRYVGLSGFALPAGGDAVQILSSIKAAQGQLVVRVRVLLARDTDGGTVTSGGAAGSAPNTAGGRQFASFADFDLLVGAPSGARPPVLSWGPAGSAAQLEPYSCALPS